MNVGVLFNALTDHELFRWQERLYHCLIEGKIPTACNIPTGLGKTAVIPIWLIAVATERARLPRRLIYIVNRRTVVDQATNVAVQLRERIRSTEGERQNLRPLRQRLEALAAFKSDDLVAISTLRGELADNEEWKKDPARPAIIIGTIDMIGSKLLFSGYGDRRYGRAHHAGLVGHDTLIVHDEAHLTPAFSDLLFAVKREQESEKKAQTELNDRNSPAEQKTGIHVMELSATGRRGEKDTVTLEDEDEGGASEPAKILRNRLDAKKRLTLHVDGKQINEKIIELALRHEHKKAKVLIYVRSPDEAQKLEGALKRKCPNRVALLTGTLRGFERDALVKTNPVYGSLLTPSSQVKETVYLVSTSAGEVGIDLDADHMVCDLTTLDSVIQRLGRVNRHGGMGRAASIDVVIPAALEDKSGSIADEALVATYAALQRLPRSEDGSFNASPREVTKLLRETLTGAERKAAFQPHPPAIPATDILFDAWSLTSIHKKLPGRPDVAAFLHGITNDPPETYVAWRCEVPLLHQTGVTDAAVRDWFRACRLKSHELLRDRTDRVFDQLAKIRARASGTPIILLDERGEAERHALDALTKENAQSMLAYRTVVLPTTAGGVTESGILDANSDRADDIDVAEKQIGAGQQPERKRSRFHLQIVSGKFRARRLEELHFSDAGAQPPRQCESARDAAAQLARERDMKVARLLALNSPIDDAEEESAEYLLLLIERAEMGVDDSEEASYKRPPTIAEHTRDVVKHVRKIAEAVLPNDSIERRALTLAGELHDLGKERDVWQRAIFNSPVNGEPLAKAGIKGMDGRSLGGYRHEFGSVLDAVRDERVKDLSHHERELVLHLIAAHHGHGRPHFEPETYDIDSSAEENELAAREALRRFGRLQLHYGRWKLAWLESLLRCADAAASAKPSPPQTAKSKRTR